MEKTTKKKTSRKKTSILQILNDIWSNIKFLRVLSVVATLISFLLGCYELYFIVDDFKSKKLIKQLGNSSLELNEGSKDFCRNWLKDVERLKDKPKYKETYYFMKGFGLTIVISKDQLFSTELSPCFYLGKITSESSYYGDAVMLRCVDIMTNSPDSLKQFKLSELIEELEKSNYQTPRYFFVKFVYAKNSHSIDRLIKYYIDFRARYLDLPNYNDNYIKDIIKSKDDKISDLTQVQTLEYLYNLEILTNVRLWKSFSNNFGEDLNQMLSKWEFSCKSFLTAINELPDSQLDFLRGGFGAFQVNNPLFPPGLHIKLFFDEHEWYKYQRFYLDKFINSTITKIHPNK
jgi:hypothetical protein